MLCYKNHCQQVNSTPQLWPHFQDSACAFVWEMRKSKSVRLIWSWERKKQEVRGQKRRSSREEIQWRNSENIEVEKRGIETEEARTLTWETDAPEFFSMPSWTLSARLEPRRLAGSLSSVVFHPGHVTPNSPWAGLSLARHQCCCTRPYGSDRFLPDRIREKKESKAGPLKHTSWKSRTPHVASSRLNSERETEGAGGFNLFSVCDCISFGGIFVFAHVTHKRTHTNLRHSGAIV